MVLKEPGLLFLSTKMRLAQRLFIVSSVQLNFFFVRFTRIAHFSRRRRLVATVAFLEVKKYSSLIKKMNFCFLINASSTIRSLDIECLIKNSYLGHEM